MRRWRMMKMRELHRRCKMHVVGLLLKWKRIVKQKKNVAPVQVSVVLEGK